MSDTEKTTSTEGAERPAFTVDNGSSDAFVSSRQQDGSFTSSVELGAFQPGEKSGEEEADEALAAETLEGDDEAGTPEEPKDGAEEEAPPAEHAAIDLPDYDPANEEVAKQYTDKYTSEDGAAINFEAFNASFLANLELGRADIHPSERAFVKDKFKLSDTAIDNYLKGVAATVRETTEASNEVVYTAFGSGTADKEGFTAALKWATEGGGYTDAQKARYNAALDAAREGDTSLLEEQAELLRVRYGAANPPAAKKEDPAPVQKQRRPSSPAASATAGAASGNNGPEPFGSYKEFTQAQSIAFDSGDRQAMKDVQERLRASPKIWKGMQG